MRLRRKLDTLMKRKINDSLRNIKSIRFYTTIDYNNCLSDNNRMVLRSSLYYKLIGMNRV